MDTLNLDIDTYTHFDLIQLFSLSTKYTPKQVNDSKNKLINQIKKNPKYRHRQKTKYSNVCR